MEYALIALIIIIAIIFVSEFQQRDVKLGRLILTGLVKGSVEVEKFIDWEKLVALNVNVGKTYKSITNSEDRIKYRRSFMTGFSVGFKSVKGNLDKFVNWRIVQRKPTKVVVAADYLLYNKTILFVLLKLKGTKLIAIGWNEGNLSSSIEKLINPPPLTLDQLKTLPKSP